jgi:lipase
VSRVFHAGAAGSDIGERFAECGFELCEVFGVVVRPRPNELGEREFSTIRAASFALPIFGTKQPQYSECCLALEREIREQPLLPVAGAVAPGFPIVALDEVHDRSVLGERTFEHDPHAEVLVVAEVREDRARAPGFRGRCIEFRIRRFGNHLREGAGSRCQPCNQLFHGDYSSANPVPFRPLTPPFSFSRALSPTIFAMREPIPTRHRVNGVELQSYEWPADGPTVFLAHATGFHARCWDQVVARLPEFRCIALDMRGHGLSSKPEPPYPWRYFGEDVAALGRELHLEGALAVGHSKGGYACTLAAALAPGIFSKLLLLDPVILPREAYVASRLVGEHFAARRRNEWPSPEVMFESFSKRPPFDRWDPAVLHDYCQYGLVPNPDGEGFVLACPPAVEAATYGGSAGGDIYDEIESLEIPVRLLRARQRADGNLMDMSGSPTAPDLASHFRQVEDISLPQYSHFIPMEDPAFVAAQVRELAGN